MSRPFLRAVTPLVPSVPDARFCGHCGQPPRDPQLTARVCDRCHLGMVLTAAQDLAPNGREPFLVVDRQLAVCAMSRSAERLLSVEEPDAVNRLLTDFLVPADADTTAQNALLALVVEAASGAAGVTRTVVRPAGEFGVFFEARIGIVGPPPAALVVLDG
ncbi:hypothetical protein [Paraconexibacter algicola]|uniref:Uncharacterized protein n=1 Tax=Paraconexibacter algicola TaxID=2133960 RepID=A0A2T4UJF7_9ACTN|nr:hypothetical protein [Paraconexibacter algicola]PTL59373.1 hypothetical protein C7Y72_06745 [Paraconexibacter algicola]